MNKEVKAIIFDVGGVLALGEKAKDSFEEKHSSGVHEIVAKKLKVSLDQYFDAIDTSYAESIEGKITKNKLLKIISKNLNTTSNRLEKLYYKTYKKKFKQNKKLYKYAFRLKKLGYKIAILSDQWHLSKKSLMPEKYIKKFDEVIVSCEVGLRKPGKEIYKLTLNKLKLKSKETIFVDNQKWNIAAAKKLGIKTILFENNKQTFEEFKKLGFEL